jgi:hypothetical protein
MYYHDALHIYSMYMILANDCKNWNIIVYYIYQPYCINTYDYWNITTLCTYKLFCMNVLLFFMSTLRELIFPSRNPSITHNLCTYYCPNNRNYPTCPSCPTCPTCSLKWSLFCLSGLSSLNFAYKACTTCPGSTACFCYSEYPGSVTCTTYAMCLVLTVIPTPIVTYYLQVSCTLMYILASPVVGLYVYALAVLPVLSYIACLPALSVLHVLTSLEARPR